MLPDAELVGHVVIFKLCQPVRVGLLHADGQVGIRLLETANASEEDDSDGDQNGRSSRESATEAQSNGADCRFASSAESGFLREARAARRSLSASTKRRRAACTSLGGKPARANALACTCFESLAQRRIFTDAGDRPAEPIGVGSGREAAISLHPIHQIGFRGEPFATRKNRTQSRRCPPRHILQKASASPSTLPRKAR